MAIVVETLDHIVMNVRDVEVAAASVRARAGHDTQGHRTGARPVRHLDAFRPPQDQPPARDRHTEAMVHGQDGGAGQRRSVLSDIVDTAGGGRSFPELWRGDRTGTEREDGRDGHDRLGLLPRSRRQPDRGVFVQVDARHDRAVRSLRPFAAAAAAVARGNHGGLSPARARLPAAAARPRDPDAGARKPRHARWRSGWSRRLRAKVPSGGVEGLIHEYALSSQEGVALMCLAEALLRIPDDETRDALIRDKIGGGDWRAHLGQSPSLFVNAATWGLMLTGRLTATSSEKSLSAALTRLVGEGRRAADPRRREHRHAPDGRAVRLRPDDRGGAGQRPPLRSRGLPLFLRHAGRGGDHRRSRPSITGWPTRRRSMPSASASAGRGIYEGAGISLKLSALHPRYSRAQAERVQAELYPRLRDLAVLARRYDIGAEHRCRGGRPAGDLARSAGAALFRSGARRLERRRLRGAGLPEARRLRDRPSDRSRPALLATG